MLFLLQLKKCYQHSLKALWLINRSYFTFYLINQSVNPIISNLPTTQGFYSRDKMLIFHICFCPKYQSAHHYRSFKSMCTAHLHYARSAAWKTCFSLSLFKLRRLKNSIGIFLKSFTVLRAYICVHRVDVAHENDYTALHCIDLLLPII